MTQRQYEITKAATFDAAHYLSEGPEHRSYRQLHGHSFRVEASVRGAPGGPVGWVADLADLEADLRAGFADVTGTPVPPAADASADTPADEAPRP